MSLLSIVAFSPLPLSPPFLPPSSQPISNLSIPLSAHSLYYRRKTQMQTMEGRKRKKEKKKVEKEKKPKRMMMKLLKFLGPQYLLYIFL
jgi:hypothetical protein